MGLTWGHSPGKKLQAILIATATTRNPQTLNPKPLTLNPKPLTLNPKPLTLKPLTLDPQPYTLNLNPSEKWLPLLV